MELRSGERVDDLGRSGLRIIQHPERFSVAMDAVLLAHFVRVKRGERLLDLGTGSGVIPLILSALHPEVQITGLELHEETAQMAERSVRLNGLQARIRIDCGDFREATTRYGTGTFHGVTINPPYREIRRGLVSPREARALARHELGGQLQEALDAASALLRYRGRVGVVFVAERLADLIEGLRQARLEPKRLRMIHSRACQPAKLVLVEAVKGAGKQLQVEPPLTVFGQGQSYTPEMQQIYGLGHGGDEPGE